MNNEPSGIPARVWWVFAVFLILSLFALVK